MQTLSHMNAVITMFLNLHSCYKKVYKDTKHGQKNTTAKQWAIKCVFYCRNKIHT